MPVRRHPIAVPKANMPLNGLPIDMALVVRLKVTYDLVRAREGRLAELFYARLFAAAPHLRGLFRGPTDAQARKLTAALDAVVDNLKDPAGNAAMLAELGRRHAGYGATPEHYDLVIDLLVESMHDALGAGADRRALDEWHMALRLMSNQMIAAANDAKDVPDPP